MSLVFFFVLMLFVGEGGLLWQVLMQQGRLLLRLEAIEAREAGNTLAAGCGAEADQVVPPFPQAKGQGETFLLQARSPRPKVFGIGLSKTGTTSLTRALRLLGYRTFHAPADLVTQVEVYRFFATRAADIYLSLLESQDALIDLPVCCLYQGLDKAYPDSKFILTVREKQAWLRSYQDHWHRHPDMFREKPDSLLAHFNHFLNEHLYGTQSANPEIFSKAYDRHTAEVYEYFRERPEDLLVLDICDGEGWSKLAPFLGVAIPEVPFPWENRGLAAPDEVQASLLSHEASLR